ncbi:cupin domain-containing protein [Achromobacter denitrificans]|uniref:cupin domain-containing protein n=1 Tax=Achromobacter denitrificans TaxID=32002 RepID=UPI002FC9AC75
MHPEADEVVRLISGAAELRLEWPTGIQAVRLQAGDAYVIPKGAWHTVKVLKPCRMLHVTMGAGTQHRPL